MAEENTNLQIDILGNEVIVAEPVVFDFEATKERLLAVLDECRGITVTETNLDSCKRKRKDLASLRNRMDDRRKEIEKKYKEPLELFKDQVKELIQMVKEIEDPLLKDINYFDDQVRESHRKYAMDVAEEIAESEGLTPEFSKKIEIKKRFLNLTIKEEEIRTDIEAQVAILKQEQEEKEATIQALRTAVETENKTITAKLNADEFISLLDRVQPVELLNRIRDRADDIRRSESEALRAKENIEDIQNIENIDEDPTTSQTRPHESETENNAIPIRQPDPVKADRHLYKATYSVVGTEEELLELSRFLKEHGYRYSVPFQTMIS